MHAQKYIRMFLVKITVVIALLGFLPAIYQARAADAPALTEYHVKALFLFNFAKYVDWPPESFSTTNAPIVIGVLGRDNFQDDLPHIIEGKTVNGRNLIIRHITSDDEIAGCHILFISSSENLRLGEALGKAAALPVLTVGEHEQFLQKGGIINFTLKEGKVRLEVNLDAARQAKLQISSKLLGVADIVKGKAN